MRILPDFKALEHPGPLPDKETMGKAVWNRQSRTFWFPPCPSLAAAPGTDAYAWACAQTARRLWMLRYVQEGPALPHPRWDDLYDFQKRGVRFILSTKKDRAGIRALLADAPRLGKTIQAIVAADLATLPTPQPKILIICLGSLKLQWEAEIKKWFSRDVPIVILNGTRKVREAQIKSFEFGFLVVHWEALRQFPELHRSMNWHWVIGDEAHKAKNRQTKTSKALHKLTGVADHVLLMSATFAEKATTDYWSPLHALNPKKYSSFYIFQDWFTYWVDTGNFPLFMGNRNNELFRELVADTLMRREVKDVEIQMPEMTERTITVKMSDHQRHWYDKIKKQVVVELGDGSELEMANAVAKIVQLRKCAISSHYFDLSRGYSAKIDALVELSKEEFGDSRFVVYCTFRDGVSKVVEALDVNGITAISAMGGTNNRVYAWKHNKSIQALVCTPQIGGVGLNLAEADYLIYMDLPWSSILYEQSIERLREPGKTRHVQVIFLECYDTIDQVVGKALRAKRERLTAMDLTKLILRHLGIAKKVND